MLPDQAGRHVTTTGSSDGSPRAVAPSSPTVLVLGTAEWSAQIATNQHYVVRELAQDVPVHFVESLGLRRVRLDGRDLTRMARRLRNAVRSAGTSAYRPVPPRATVISPLVVPMHRRPTRVINRVLLERAVARWRQSPRPRVLWAFTPVTYGLERFADYTVYHCVDLLHAFPGIDAVAVAAGERNLAVHANLAIATSEVVADHLRAVGFSEVLTLPNVADVDIFAAASRPAAQRRPAAIFAGNLSPHKLDVDLLRALADALRGRGELVLAGPLASGGGTFDRELTELERAGARYVGVLTVDQLAELTGASTVGLVPYALNDYTVGVSPLKCYEYLASGLHVVATPIPDVVRAASASPGLIDVRQSVREFVDAVLEAIQPAPDPQVRARVEYAGQFGWRSRGALLRSILADRVGGQGGATAGWQA